MNNLNVTFGPYGTLSLSTKASQKEIDAFFYTMTKAQKEARRIDPDPSSAGYFTAMTDELGNLGWSGTHITPFEYQPGSKPVAPLTALMNAYIGFVQDGIPTVRIDKGMLDRCLAKGFDALRRAPPNVTGMLDRWWGRTDIKADARVMTVGPLIDLVGIPVVAAGQCALTITADSWRALITPSSDFQLRIAPSVMSLNWMTYWRIEKALKKELAADLAWHLETTKLDLQGDTLEAVQ